MGQREQCAACAGLHGASGRVVQRPSCLLRLPCSAELAGVRAELEGERTLAAQRSAEHAEAATQLEAAQRKLAEAEVQAAAAQRAAFETAAELERMRGQHEVAQAEAATRLAGGPGVQRGESTAAVVRPFFHDCGWPFPSPHAALQPRWKPRERPSGSCWCCQLPWQSSRQRPMRLRRGQTASRSAAASCRRIPPAWPACWRSAITS